MKKVGREVVAMVVAGTTAAFVVVVAPPSFAVSDALYGGDKECWDCGFYFGKEKPEKAEETAVAAPTPVPTPSPTPTPPPLLSAPTAPSEEVAPTPPPARRWPSQMSDEELERFEKMPVGELKVMIEEARDRALTYIGEEAAYDYAYLQAVSKDRASRMAKTMKLIQAKYPALERGTQHQGARPGRVAQIGIHADETKETLAAAREEYGLLYFYSPECRYCRAQTPLIQEFAERHEWRVEPVNILADRGMAERFKVTSTPTIMLVSRDKKEPFLLAQGFVALSELEEKVRQVVNYLDGRTTAETFTAYLSDIEAERQRRHTKSRDTAYETMSNPLPGKYGE